MLLIAGTERDVGKTTLACRIIERLAPQGGVTGVKISPHWHADAGGTLVADGAGFVIFREEQASSKDSGRMYAAGARPVFFVMADEEALAEAFRALLPLLPPGPLVCESGGLRRLVEPGLFLFVTKGSVPPGKEDLLTYLPVAVEYHKGIFDPAPEHILYHGGRWTVV